MRGGQDDKGHGRLKKQDSSAQPRIGEAGERLLKQPEITSETGLLANTGRLDSTESGCVSRVG